jgi:hypothetical protein
MKKIELSKVLVNASKLKFQVFKNTANKFSAGNRIANNNFVNIYKEPKFKISKETKIFTLGSCFAREIEEKLHSSGLIIMNMNYSLPEKYRITGRWVNNEEYRKHGLTTESERSILNKYSIRSMIDAIQIAARLEKIDIEKYLIEYNGKFLNPYQHLPLPLDKNEAIELFLTSMEQFKKVSDSDLFIITLGQTELWYDNNTRKYINGTPPTLGYDKNYSRFELHIPSMSEVMEDLRELICILKDRSAAAQIILTVSPVPFSRTFSPEDAITSNSLSKSMLLIAARDLADKLDYVDYYPSFEMVTSSNRSWAYEPDMVHVMPRCVEQVVSHFIEDYII